MNNNRDDIYEKADRHFQAIALRNEKLNEFLPGQVTQCFSPKTIHDWYESRFLCLALLVGSAQSTETPIRKSPPEFL